MAKSIRLVGPRQREYAKQMIDDAPDGYVVKVAKETRRDAQNRKMHAMIRDIRRHVPDMAAFSAEDTKLRFLDALGSELRFLPKIEGQGHFPVGLRSSTLTVQQFAFLIELLYIYGNRNDVRWSEPIYEDKR